PECERGANNSWRTLGSRGQDDSHARSDTRRALDVKRPVHLPDNGSADGKPQSVPAGLGRKERLKHLCEMFAGYATTGIFDRQINSALRPPRPDREASAPGHRIAGIR